MPRTARRFANTVPQDLVAELAYWEAKRQELSPAIFASSWRCNRPACDGKPHDQWQGKHARGPRHRSPQVIPADAWHPYTDDKGNVHDIQTALIEGGRGSGKTQAGAWNFGQMVLDTPPDPGDDHTEWAVVTRTFAQGRSVAIEGPSGLLRSLGPVVKKRGWSRSEGRLELVDGAVIWLDSANDGGIRIQGKNLYGAWVEEPGLWLKWQRAWNESMAFALRKGPARVIATGTPKRIGLSRTLHNDPSVWKVRLITRDNMDNLAGHRVRWLLNRFEGTPLGRQELEGILLDEVEGALWTRALIDRSRRYEHEPECLLGDNEHCACRYEPLITLRPPAYWGQSMLGLDPADGLTEGDEQAMTLVRQSPEDGHLYVVHSDGMRAEPWDFLKEAVTVASSISTPATLIVEKNHGGRALLNLMDHVMRALQRWVPYQAVDATKDTGDKYTRAEPVAGLYHQGKVHHLGDFAELEDQMVTWTGLPDPDTGKKPPSPDRLDSLVWACWGALGWTLATGGARSTWVGDSGETVEGAEYQDELRSRIAKEREFVSAAKREMEAEMDRNYGQGSPTPPRPGSNFVGWD